MPRIRKRLAREWENCGIMDNAMKKQAALSHAFAYCPCLLCHSMARPVTHGDGEFQTNEIRILEFPIPNQPHRLSRDAA